MKKLFSFIFTLIMSTGYAQEKQMCVTVDDLPVVSYGTDDPDFLMSVTQRLINTFNKYQIPAIGYVNEQKLYKNGVIDSGRVQLLELWLKNGYELGNHTFSHMNYHTVSLREFTDDIIKGEAVTKKLAEKYKTDYKYFRHPYLRSGLTKEHSDSLENFLHQAGYVAAPVTIDNDDYLFAKAYHLAYNDKNTAQMEEIGKAYISYMEEKLLYFERSAAALFGRSINQTLLIHANLINADYLDDLAEVYKKHGYRFISQTEALKDEAYGSEITKFGDWGISWLDRWALSKGKKGDFFKEDPPTPEFILELSR